MKFFKKTISIILISQISWFKPARADLFGGDVAVLIQILSTSLQQLVQLQQILGQSKDSLNLLKDINRGINDSLQLMETLGPYFPPGVYSEYRKIKEVVGHIQSVYGIVTSSPLETIQQDTDQVASEAISFNNEVGIYSKNIDKIGEEIKAYSHAVSPGGAQKLTAQTLGVMIHVMNQQLRAQGQSLKLQAQGLIVENKRNKDATTQYLHEADTLAAAMKSDQIKFEMPRF